MIEAILKASLFFLSLLLCELPCFAGNSLSVTVQYTDNAGNIKIVPSPSQLNQILNTPLTQLQITLTGTISSFSFTDNNLTTNSWGITFQNSSSSSGTSTQQVICTQTSPCMGLRVNTMPSGIPAASGTSPTFQVNNANLNLTVRITPASGNTTFTLSGTTLAPLLASNGVSVGFVYTPAAQGSSSTNNFFGTDFALWQADNGAFINPPTVAGKNQSIIASDGAFVVTNLNPPKDTSAVCPFNTSSNSCTNDGSTAQKLSTTGNNALSGYVIGFWRDQDCLKGGFKFSPNWMAYNFAQPSPSYSCSYTPYSLNFSTGGFSSLLGCSGISSIPFLSGSITPTADTAAIPYITTNPKIDLQRMIQNPGTPFTSPSNDSCISYVYVPSSQKSWSKSGIKNGDVYGVVVWALNSAIDSSYSVPSYSLAHSYIYYTTGVTFELASLAKNPSLSKSADCFVVTAASGDTNSKSVFYWRVLRDSYLLPLGLTKFYYSHAQNWAQWLNRHPHLKPALNYFFEKSGYGLYHFGEFIKEKSTLIKEKSNLFFNKLSIILFPEAQAQEENPLFEENPNNKIKYGFHQKENSLQQDIPVVIEEKMEKDPFFHVERDTLTPKYSINITGGILFPTYDSATYDSYYSSQPSVLGQIGISYFPKWFGSFGWFAGMKGRYLGNSQTANSNVLGTNQTYSRKFYAISALAITGVQYRSTNFIYIQPGVYLGAGMNRFREDASAQASTASAVGVVFYSPIYEIGTTLDFSLSHMTNQTEIDKGDWLNDVLLRLEAVYNSNPTSSLSTTGYFLNAGFAFLIN